MNWGWLRGYDNGDFEDGDNADNFMGGGPLGILLYQMRYSGRCSVFYIELLLEDIDWEGGQNSNHIVVGFPTSGWVSNQWLEIHPWWVNFQPFTLVGLDAVVLGFVQKGGTVVQLIILTRSQKTSVFTAFESHIVTKVSLTNLKFCFFLCFFLFCNKPIAAWKLMLGHCC